MPDDRYFEKYQYGIGDSDQPGVHQALEAEFDEEEEVQCQRCKRGVNLFHEAIFVMDITLEDIKKGQEFWCKKCAVEGMKWSNKHPLLKGDLS